MAEKEQVSKDQRYGCCCFKPGFLQGLNRGVWFCVFLSLGNAFQSMVANGLVGTILSTLEKRFSFSSSAAGFISSTYDIASLPTVIVLSFWGHKGHRPLLTGLGLLGVGIGCILFSLPHFITGNYSPSGSGVFDSGLCSNRTGVDLCSSEENPGGDTDDSNMYWVFIVARLIQGLSCTTLSTIAVTYMDDCVTKEQFSLYIAFFYCGGVVGPAIGFIGGGYLLSVYTDFYSVDPEKDLGLLGDDPRWVGNWWLGWLAGGAAILLCSIPFFGYPKDMPGAEEIRAMKTTEAYKADQKLDDEEVPQDLSNTTFRQLPTILKSLLTNPTFIFLMLYNSCDLFLLSGFTSYGPKYVEEQFSMPASTAGMLFGAMSVPAGLGGCILAGWIVSRFKFTLDGILKFMAGLSLAVTVFGLCFLIMCDGVAFAGVNQQYNTSSSESNMNLSAQCNIDCMCADVAYDPICSTANVKYYSPCHAGCSDMIKDGNKKYHNCSCLDPNDDGIAQATSNTCTSSSCTLSPLFFAMFFIAMWLLMMCDPCTLSATIRSVLPAERGVAIGIQFIITKLLGAIPAPTAFGAVFDASCDLWQERCDQKGSCISYNNHRLGPYVFAMAMGVKFASFIFVLVAWKLYRPPMIDVMEEKVLNSMDRESPDKKEDQVTNGITSSVFQNDVLDVNKWDLDNFQITPM